MEERRELPSPATSHPGQRLQMEQRLSSTCACRVLEPRDWVGIPRAKVLLLHFQWVLVNSLLLCTAPTSGTDLYNVGILLPFFIKGNFLFQHIIERWFCCFPRGGPRTTPLYFFFSFFICILWGGGKVSISVCISTGF